MAEHQDNQGSDPRLAIAQAHLEDARLALAAIRDAAHAWQGASSRMNVVGRAKEALDAIDLAEAAMGDLASDNRACS